MSTREREIVRWFEERRQLIASGLSRREAARMGLLTTAGGALAGVAGRPGPAQAAGAAASPWDASWAWQDPLPIPPVLRPVGKDLPNCNHAAHQYYDEYPAQVAYQMTAKAIRNYAWNSKLAAAAGPDNMSWGYDGIFPGPTLDLHYGRPVLLRHTNALPKANWGGWAYPGSITHLHNMHTASESDGGPWRYTMPGESTDHHYCMHRAGFSTGKVPKEFRDAHGGDTRETLSSLFYHQHMPGYTASNVYRGLVGFCRVFDEKDTGREDNAWGLPSGPYDIPLVLADKKFAPDGNVFFDPLTTDGFLGDLLTVNGKVQPYLEVEPRKYRFRLLSAGPSRFYALALRADGKDLPYVQISDNGNLLERTVTWAGSSTRPMELWVAERSDIVVDFAGLGGKTVHLSNVLPMRPDGKGADRGAPLLKADDPRNQLLQFRVTRPLRTGRADNGPVPKGFRPYPLPLPGEAVATKTFEFKRSGGGWVIDVDGKGGVPWDPDADHTPEMLKNPVNRVKKNTAEIWRLRNSSGGWEHPIHVHFEEGMIVKSHGVAQPVRARQDVYRMGNGTDVEVFLRFRDYPQPGFTAAPPVPVGEKPGNDLPPIKDDAAKHDVNAGRYVMHCHNVVHEDHSMMVSWSIVP